MSKAKPILSDLPAHKIKFRPGDRVIARVSTNLNKDQIRRVKQGVKKFANNEDVRVLVVNVLECQIYLSRPGEELHTIAHPSQAKHKTLDAGNANLDCSIVDIWEGDKVLVFVPRVRSENHRKMISDWIMEWTGKGVEIAVAEGANF